MSNLTINPQWHDTINQVERNEPITGGADGNANIATKQLAECVFWLKQQFEQSSQGQLPIGTIVQISQHFANASEFAKHMGYGRWRRALEGRIGVGFSTKADDPIEFKTHGKEYGEFKHTLTIEEMPRHRHEWKFGREQDDDSTGGSNDEFTYQALNDNGVNADHPIDYAGGDQPHNNQPPSKTIDMWERIA